MSISRWMDKEYVVYIYICNWVLLRYRKNLVICDNMDGSRGHCTKWNESDKENLVWYHMLNLKNKTKEPTKPNENRLISTEKKWVFIRGEGAWGQNRWRELRDSNFQLENKSHGGVLYSIRNIINNTVITFYGDRLLPNIVVIIPVCI